MNILRIILIPLLLVIYSVARTQETTEIKKIRFGLDIGLDVPNNRYSQFLEGSHPYGVGRYLNNRDTKRQIESELGYPIIGWEFSQQTNYQPAVFAGLYLGFDVKESLSVIMKLNFNVVKCNTPFVLALDNPRNFTGEFEQGEISATEQRFFYALGIEKKIELDNPKLTPYFAVGGSFNYIQLERHSLILNKRTTYEQCIF